MLFAEFKNKTARRNVLAKVDILGSFDFHTLLISLEALSAPDAQRMWNAFAGEAVSEVLARGGLTLDQFESAAKILPLAAHEYTHFLDATSTLWGFRHLRLMNEAYLSSDRYGADEMQFAKAKRFYDHGRRIGLPNYYTVVDSTTPNTRPWQSETSVGKLFSNDGTPTDEPILFSRFSNRDGALLARSPISTVSLLEASAMAQELLLHSTLIQMIDPAFRVVEAQRFSEQTAEYLYNPNITEYSVCAHLVANMQECPDILAAFQLCAIIIRFVLNLPESSLQKIIDTCPIEDLLNLAHGNSVAKALRNGLRSGNLGILFYLICAALPEQSHVSYEASVNGTVAALGTLGLNHATLREEGHAQASEVCTEIFPSEIQSISAIAKAGYDNFLKIPDDRPALNFSGLSLPPVFLGDSSVSLVFNADAQLLRDFDVDRCFHELYEGQTWVERFSEACI